MRIADAAMFRENDDYIETEDFDYVEHNFFFLWYFFKVWKAIDEY